MATHSSMLAWKIPWTEEPGGPQSMGLKESDTTERLTLYSFFVDLGKLPGFQCQRRKQQKHFFKQSSAPGTEASILTLRY